MNQQSRDLAIMFADVSNSSALYKRLGNVDAKRLVDKTLDIMRRLTAEQAGTVVKTIGDEIMARFDSAGDACRAAMAIQQYCSMASGDEARSEEHTSELQSRGHLISSLQLEKKKYINVTVL